MRLEWRKSTGRMWWCRRRMQERTWVDVGVGGHKKKRERGAAKGGDDVKLEGAEGERERGVEMTSWRQRPRDTTTFTEKWRCKRESLHREEGGGWQGGKRRREDADDKAVKLSRWKHERAIYAIEDLLIISRELCWVYCGFVSQCNLKLQDRQDVASIYLSHSYLLAVGKTTEKHQWRH